MSRRDLNKDPGDDWHAEEWDREHFERWMETVRSNQRDPEESYGSVGGTPYQGGVFSTATYGSGAEYYSITGMYENPLLEKGKRRVVHKRAA